MESIVIRMLRQQQSLIIILTLHSTIYLRITNQCPWWHYSLQGKTAWWNTLSQQLMAAISALISNKIITTNSFKVPSSVHWTMTHRSKKAIIIWQKNTISAQLAKSCDCDNWLATSLKILTMTMMTIQLCKKLPQVVAQQQFKETIPPATTS